MKRIFIVLILLLLAACGSKVNPAAEAVKAYFEALVQSPEQAVTRSCAAWEEQAALDADTFTINPATAEQIVCQEAGKDGSATIVSCSGKLVLDYNGEKQEINLADRTYLAVEEGGEWRMCGYK